MVARAFVGRATLAKRVSAQEAHDNWPDVLDSVYYTKEAVIVEKQGRPFAVLISPEDYERLLRAREERFAALDALRAKNSDLTAEEAEADAAREVEAERRHRARNAATDRPCR